MIVLQIIFTILSALCLAALLPAGTFGGMPYFLVCAGGAGVFFLLVLLCKKLEYTAKIGFLPAADSPAAKVTACSSAIPTS